MGIKDISIGYNSLEQLERAQQLATELNLKIDNQAQRQLLVMQDKLALKVGNFNPLWADFSLSGERKSKPALVKACKVAPGKFIIDATAGWGRDAAILANFGAKVLMLEREPIMGVLLADGLQRLNIDCRLHLTLIVQDTLEYLSGLTTNYPDVIYIDPMHPKRQKTALVKKDMQMLQQLLEPDNNLIELIQLAKLKAKDRVVVKWPQSAPSISNILAPTFCIPGKTVRFEVFLLR